MGYVGFKFKVGDFVTRRSEVMNDRSPLMHGIVIKAYEARLAFGYYPELYDVEWVRPAPSFGYRYLPNGLAREE